MPDLSPENVEVLKEQVFGSQSINQSPSSQTETANTETVTTITAPSTETQPQQQAASVPTPSTESSTDNTQNQDVEYIDPAAWLKQNFDFDTVESAQEWINKQRELEKNPPKYEPTYANDEAKRWAEYITGGKEEELYQNLHARRQVKDIDTLSDEAKLKLYIRMQNPLFDQELVDYQFQRQYGFNEAEYKDEDGNITDPMAYRFAKIDAQQKMQNDIARASEYFNQYKTKLDLSPLQQKQEAQSVDEGYEAYRQLVERHSQSQRELEESLNKITENEIKYNYKFNDEASKLGFDIDFLADKQGFESARKAAANYVEFIQSNYTAQDGTPMNNKLVRDIYIAQNLDKFAAEIAKQAINADRKWFLANQKNITDASVRQYNTVVPDDVQRLKEQVFGKTG